MTVVEVGIADHVAIVTLNRAISPKKRRWRCDRVAVLMATSDAREGPAAFMEKRSPVFQGQ